MCRDPSLTNPWVQRHEIVFFLSCVLSAPYKRVRVCLVRQSVLVLGVV